MAFTPSKKVRDAMHEGCECIGEQQSVLDAAKRMEQLDVGAMPICGDDDRLKGMLTDRDIVVKVLAHDMDPTATRAGELAQGKLLWIDVDAPMKDALSLMREHAIKRLPVVDENKRLCGIVTERDIGTHMSDKETGELVGAIASAQPQHF